LASSNGRVEVLEWLRLKNSGLPLK
jgi:hypothetical protein